MNFSPGMKVMVRRRGGFFQGIVVRTEIEDGEEYVIGNLVRSPKTNFDETTYFREHRDDVKPWVQPPGGDY